MNIKKLEFFLDILNVNNFPGLKYSSGLGQDNVVPENIHTPTMEGFLNRTPTPLEIPF